VRSHGVDHPQCPVRLVTDLRVSRVEFIRRRPGIRLDRWISLGRVLSRFRGSLRVEPSTPLPPSSLTTLTAEGVRRFRPAVTCWTRRRQHPRHARHVCCTRAVRWQPRFMGTAEERHTLVTLHNYQGREKFLHYLIRGIISADETLQCVFIYWKKEMSMIRCIVWNNPHFLLINNSSAVFIFYKFHF